MRYITAKESAKRIREEIKERFGLNSRQVSVQSDAISISVKVKDPDAPIKEIRKIAKKYESIDYDHATGEILSGGNLYVSTVASREVHQAWRERYHEAVEKALDELAKTEPGYHVKIAEGGGFRISVDRQRPYIVQIWNESGHVADSYIDNAERDTCSHIGASIASGKA